jgi:predicted dehydrogenase
MQRRRFISRIGQAGIVTVASNLVPAGVVRAASSPTPRLRIAQIGTTHAHADGKLAVLRRSADFELVGVVEPDEQLRRAAESRKDYQGVRWLTEEQLFNTPGLHAIAVETQVKDLLPTAARCVSRGLHIHLDKPAGESLPEFQRLLDAATQKKLTVQMGYMFRYNPAFQFCFRAAREGWLGKVFSIETVIGKASGLEERKKLLPYRGGSMFELGCHVIDAVVTVLGKPLKISAQARHAGAFSDGLLDNQLATLEYPYALVTVRSSHVEVEGGARRQFVVCGDRGTVEIRPLEPPALRLALAAPHGEFKKGNQDVPLKNRPRYEADFEDLAKVIRGEKAFDWTPAHDLATQETILRASGLPVV